MWARQGVVGELCSLMIFMRFSIYLQAKQQTCTKEKITQMFNLAFDANAEKEKRIQVRWIWGSIFTPTHIFYNI